MRARDTHSQHPALIFSLESCIFFKIYQIYAKSCVTQKFCDPKPRVPYTYFFEISNLG